MLTDRLPSASFFRAVLGPLLDLPPPAHPLMMVVDALDVGYRGGERSGKSGSIAELLAANQHLLPSWLLLVCSVRRHNKAVCKMFSGRKLLIPWAVIILVSSTNRNDVLSSLLLFSIFISLPPHKGRRDVLFCRS